MKKSLLLTILLMVGYTLLYSQNVGIGTNSPITKLDILSGNNWDLVNGEGDVRLGNSTYRLKIGLATAGGGAGATGIMQYGQPGGYNVLSLGAQGNYILQLNGSSNRAGIGTDNPAGKLTILSSGGIGEPQLHIQQTNTGDYSRIRMQTNASFYWDIASFTGTTVANDRLNFYSNRVGDVLTLTGNGTVGIGNNNANAPLAFAAALGKKITLYPGVSGDVGFGVQGNLFQIYSDYSGADIAFGYGTSTAFTENMRIKGTGNVGIGTSSPGFLLDVNGRMRIRSGGSLATSAGLWLNNSSNTGVPAFIGMEDDIYVGFFGNGGAGWKFGMNVQSGALKVNGSTGQVGQVITSSGSGAAAVWSSSTSTLYNNTVSIVNQSSITLGTSSGVQLLPGMTYSFSIPGNAKLLISYGIPAQTIGCTFCGITSVYIDIVINGGLNNRSLWDIQNGARQTLSNSKVISLTPGAYTVEIQASAIGPDTIFGGCCIFDKMMNILVIPQ